MARTVTPLNNTQVKNAKPKDKEYNLSDGQGLMLRVKPNGSKIWIFNYYHPHTNKRKAISLGSYPDLSIAEARNIRSHNRSLIANGIDPQSNRDDEKRRLAEAQNNTFKQLSAEWIKLKAPEVTSDTLRTSINSMEKDVYPIIGNMPVSEITYKHGKQVIKQVVNRGSYELAKKLASRINQVMDLAVRNELILNNPLTSLRKDIPKAEVKHNPTLTAEELPELMRAIAFSGITIATRCMLELKLHTLTRSTVVAIAKWEQFDFDKALWIIPPVEGTKVRKTAVNKQPFVVPITKQVKNILDIMKPISGHREYVFPNHYNPRMHANGETMNTALKRMGFKDRTTAHGLRSLASTTLNEQGFEPDVIEKALFHVDKDSIRKIYNRAEYIERRRVMLSWWSDFIEQAANGNMSLSNAKQSLRLVNG